MQKNNQIASVKFDRSILPSICNLMVAKSALKLSLVFHRTPRLETNKIVIWDHACLEQYILPEKHDSFCRLQVNYVVYILIPNNSDTHTIIMSLVKEKKTRQINLFTHFNIKKGQLLNAGGKVVHQLEVAQQLITCKNINGFHVKHIDHQGFILHTLR